MNIDPHVNINIPSNSGGSTHSSLLVIFIIFGIAAFLGLVAFGAKSAWIAARRKKRLNEGDTPTNEPLLDDSNSNNQNLPLGYMGKGPIMLGKVVAKGKFGWVRKVSFGKKSFVGKKFENSKLFVFCTQATDGAGNSVAVKMFEANDHASWLTERTVYCLPQMKHPNILTYLGAEKHTEDNNIYWHLITEYHELGSLYDYLKSHTINMKEFLTIFVGIARGMSHFIILSPALKSTHFTRFLY